MTTPIVIGIAGGTGSGKTTFADRVFDRFKADTVILRHDYYYKPFDEIPFEQRKLLNFDHPDAFDTGLMADDIKTLLSGHTAYRPDYSFTEFTRLEHKVKIQPSKLIIAEGILIFDSAVLRNLFDIKIYVDADADERLIRRVTRDVKERGRSLDSVLRQYLETVKPMHDKYVEPSKNFADIIVPVGGFNQVALEMVCDRIKSLLNVRTIS